MSDYKNFDKSYEFQIELENYLEQRDIKIQHTWIHTSDQNGVVERSHKTNEKEFYQEVDINYSDLENINTKLKIWFEYYNIKRLYFSLNYQISEEYLISNI